MTENTDPKPIADAYADAFAKGAKAKPRTVSFKEVHVEKNESSEGCSNYDDVPSEDDDSFNANDERSEDAWSDEACRLNKAEAPPLEKQASGNHLHVGRISPRHAQEKSPDEYEE